MSEKEKVRVAISRKLNAADKAAVQAAVANALGLSPDLVVLDDGIIIPNDPKTPPPPEEP